MVKLILFELLGDIMYLIKYLSNIETNTIVVAVAQPSELFDMCCVLEDSKHVIAWYIVGYKPSDFWLGIRQFITS